MTPPVYFIVCLIIKGSTPGILIMETMMEHVARTSGQDPIVVKQNNLYIEGQVIVL